MTRNTPSLSLPLQGEGVRKARSAPHSRATPDDGAFPSPCQGEGQGGGHRARTGAPT